MGRHTRPITETAFAMKAVERGVRFSGGTLRGRWKGRWKGRPERHRCCFVAPIFRVVLKAIWWGKKFSGLSGWSFCWFIFSAWCCTFPQISININGIFEPTVRPVKSLHPTLIRMIPGSCFRKPRLHFYIIIRPLRCIFINFSLNLTTNRRFTYSWLQNASCWLDWSIFGQEYFLK